MHQSPGNFSKTASTITTRQISSSSTKETWLRHTTTATGALCCTMLHKPGRDAALQMSLPVITRDLRTLTRDPEDFTLASTSLASSTRKYMVGTQVTFSSD